LLPSLVAEDLRASLTSFLGTTFALGDDDVRAELERFVADPDNGVFRGPFVRLRLPFRPADDEWRAHLDWSPRGFLPHRHQAQAWVRLASRDHVPRATLVTTGTGSGKTEAFLVPLLDHCGRQRRAGQQGIKALVLYPMNALANDQARRVATFIHQHKELGGVTVGLYTGDSDGGVAMTETSVIGDRYAMRKSPPDILLTNYRMLDMLLLRSEDAPLFANADESLRYLVLDEFHTYDGAQGTDVAMLLRRLGLTLGVTTDERPLGAITAVATSATLGGGADGGAALREFAETVFGAEFDEISLIGEDRLTAEEWVTTPQGQTPLLDEVTAALRDCTSHEEQLTQGKRLFLGMADGDNEALGDQLRAHPLTRTLLHLTATPCALSDLAQDLVPSWVASTDERRAAARHAVALYLALLSRARTAGSRPLLDVDVQLWVREVSRLLRQLSSSPGFRWHDGAVVEDGAKLLPAIYCRHCGRSGWGVVVSAGGAHDTSPPSIWSKTAVDPSTARAWIFAPGEAAQGSTDVRWVDAVTTDFVPASTRRHGTQVPVLVTPDAQAAKDEQCPSCGLKDGIRYLGSRVATLASVTLGQLFGSPDVTAAEKKTLVFTDSVQDASHRAAFVESRAYALNLRALLHRAIGQDGCTLATVGGAIASSARTPAERYAVLPPDLREHEVFCGYWNTDKPEARVRRAVAKRMSFAAVLEFGLSSRTGRTLELTGAVTAQVHVENLAGAVASALAVVARQDVQLTLDGVGPIQTTAWARGIVERIRTQGGIGHVWLRKFAASGNRHSIWNGRPRREGMPAFPKQRPAPSFPTSARHSDAFDSVIGPRNWYATWTARALGVPTVDASRYVRALLDALVTDGALTTVVADSGTTVWQIPAERVHLARTSGAPRLLRCTVCATRFPGPDLVLDELTGAPCQRDRCPGRYVLERSEHDFYRDLYRGGNVRRIVAREHTSLLPAQERVELENAFKSSARPDVPNVLTCTPTLELGIDIGDLSTVALTSLPRSTASYLQRVGRAGRLTGNALIVSLLPARPLELQRLLDPLTMIDGDVVPPACYLDATEILRRQYLASLFDRHARSANTGRTRLAKDVFTGGLSATSWLGRIVADAHAHAQDYVDDFLRGFGNAVSKDTAADLRAWAGDGRPQGQPPGIELDVEAAVVAWVQEGEELASRFAALETEITVMQARPSLDEACERDLRRLFGELGAARSARSARDRAYWISALEAKGLLPNYALLDDTTRLDVGLWWTDEETGAHEASDERYVRGSRTALHELAPGATFYVRGTSVEIDGIDLGTSRNPATVVRRFCPACGWSGRVTPDAAVVACPRCGAAGAADAGQVLTTLPFRRASAYASRELAMRDDDTEDRRRTRFTVVTTVDCSPNDITQAWELADFPFGAEVLRAADIRWVNLGPTERGGSPMSVAGQEFAAALFDACVHCGVVPAAQRGVRDRADARHRGWCRQRREPTPTDWKTVALTHTLRTQAVRLLVPPIVVADRTLLTSFRAALLLGLRQVLGGDPDHLDVVAAADPVPGSSERWVMVLHDLVPGGTGYLGRFTDPQRVKDLLDASLSVLRNCPCGSENVAACHRCLLPYVPAHFAPDTRRDAGIDLLAQILDRWEPRPIDTIKRIVVGSHDTPIEMRFRALLLRWAKSKGTVVSIQATSYGDSAKITFPQSLGGLQWTLAPQVKLGGVQPDFVLTCADREVPQVAVFCDSQRWHSSIQTNCLAEDAGQRADLRDQDYLVWAVTHHDLDAFAATLDRQPAQPPTWCEDPLRAMFVQVGRKMAAPGSVEPDVLLRDPVSMLTEFLLRPSREAWTSPAHSLALALSRGAGTRKLDGAALPALLCSELGPASGELPAGQTTVAMRRTARGAVVALEMRELRDVRAWLAVDDRDEVVGSAQQVDAWRDWLAVSNLLQFLEPGRFQAHTYVTAVEASVAPVAVGLLPRQWHDIADVSDGVVRSLVLNLALAGDELPLPEAGHEVDDGEYMIDLAWPDHRVAVVADVDHDRDEWLAMHGWTVVPADEQAVRAVLHTAAGGR
jgi:DEAD/DEAH box helicase/Helicase conserved C-terminal domain